MEYLALTSLHILFGRSILKIHTELLDQHIFRDSYDAVP